MIKSRRPRNFGTFLLLTTQEPCENCDVMRKAVGWLASTLDLQSKNAKLTQRTTWENIIATLEASSPSSRPQLAVVERLIDEASASQSLLLCTSPFSTPTNSTLNADIGPLVDDDTRQTMLKILRRYQGLLSSQTNNVCLKL